ncbi:ATPase [Plectosphaerella plurivora]|uniref:ATPase n=1 Tax=Plectosphaerella plurivora TaxID=936078 RepID=A0A9P9AA53_9PEZI|nr:ATPase [Plectosphaerella plurivora]
MARTRQADDSDDEDRRKNESEDTPASDSEDQNENDAANEEKENEDNAEDIDETMDEETAKAVPGSISDTIQLYKSKKDEDGNWTWTDKYPENVYDAAENKRTAKYALVVRNVKSQDSRKKLEAHSIVIQSPWLKTALADVLKDYPGVACELQRLEFKAPFQPFVHRWQEFDAYSKRDDLDEPTRAHVEMLHKILTYEIGDKIQAFEDYMRNGVVTFEDLWMIFPPGAPIVSAFQGPLSAFETSEIEYTETRCGRFLEIRCDCVDYNGTEFGRYQEKMNIAEFLGTKKITGLKVYPLSFHEDQNALRQSLERRGQTFEDLAGNHYKEYAGTAITWDRDGNEVPIQITGRIVVDIKSFNSYSPYPCRYLDDWTPRDLEALAKYTAENGPGPDGNLKLTPYHKLLTRSRTRGYSIKLKKWLDFFIDTITDISWSTSAFDKLVLPEDQKDLILSFAESQLEGSNFDDVIAGKGKGIICLLSGPPGVGKTLTAEAVAESLRVPLHTLSSGDLGSGSWEVERNLSEILDLVARWKAILLIDECDVFLEARSTHDLERNKVVSIFLRTLEYYEGILFMTTNRVGNIDQAFQSRIHVSLEYPDLTPESRRVIWKNFLIGTSAENLFTGKDLDELAALKLNGRQIKNILKTSQLLAARRKSPLSRKFIDTVLAIENRRPTA